MLSSDWYWEHDEEFRLTKVVGGRAYDHNVGLRRGYGQRPWEAASENMEEADWDSHRRQLEAHEPFRDFEITHRGDDGELHTVSVSGEPVFDEHGRFTGYRGVGRDISAIDIVMLVKGVCESARHFQHLGNEIIGRQLDLTCAAISTEPAQRPLRGRPPTAEDFEQAMSCKVAAATRRAG